jgi:uncharacterized membrane protein YoaK (UPF0700 family)
MMTGNTIFLALALVKIPTSQGHNSNTAWVRNFVTLLSYCLGAFLFPRFHRAFGDRKRWVLMSSFMLQAVFIFIAAALVQGGVVSDMPDQGNVLAPFLWTSLAPLALCAFQAAGQFAASRVLGFAELPTNVLTSLYSDLMGDPKLFVRLGRKRNVKRRRRIIGALCLFVGALIGGAMNEHVRMASVLWLGGGLKSCIVVAWAVWWVETEVKGQHKG